MQLLQPTAFHCRLSRRRAVYAAAITTTTTTTCITRDIRSAWRSHAPWLHAHWIKSVLLSCLYGKVFMLMRSPIAFDVIVNSHESALTQRMRIGSLPRAANEEQFRAKYLWYESRICRVYCRRVSAASLWRDSYQCIKPTFRTSPIERLIFPLRERSVTWDSDPDGAALYRLKLCIVNQLPACCETKSFVRLVCKRDRSRTQFSTWLCRWKSGKATDVYLVQK